MLRLLVRWFLDALALLIVAWLVPGFKVANLPSALIAVIIIGLLNVTLGFLLKLITLPLGILTLGLFFLVINALILKLASGVVPGFYVNSFGAAFIGAAVLALLPMLFEAISSWGFSGSVDSGTATPFGLCASRVTVARPLVAFRSERARAFSGAMIG